MCKICRREYDENTTELRLSGCRKLTAIPSDLVSLQQLDCSNFIRLTTIPVLPSLQSLDCSYCSDLTTIPVLLSLQRLYFHDCPKLTTIPELASLQMLYCYNCPMLTTVPVLVSLQTLSLDKCRMMATIPVLASLQSLYCDECPMLTAIFGDLEALRWFYYNNCPNLVRIPTVTQNLMPRYMYNEIQERLALKQREISAELVPQFYPEIAALIAEYVL